MGLLSFINPVLDFLFSPLFKIHPFFSILVITLIVSFIITIIYKYATDQTAMKAIKKKQKDLNKKLKEAKNDPEKAMKIQKEMMSLSGEMMKSSFKPMLYTFIPIIIIFGWMSGNFAYDSIRPDEEFQISVIFGSKNEGTVNIIVPEEIEVIGSSVSDIIDKRATWTLSGKEGDYVIMFEYNGETLSKKVKITDSGKYYPVSKRSKTFIDSIYSNSDEFITKPSSALEIKVHNRSLKVLPFKIIKWDNWLVTYILLSIIFSTVLRKIMDIS